jgi:hypothetical protein
MSDYIEEKKDAALAALRIGGIDAVLTMHTKRVGEVKNAEGLEGGVRWSTEAIVAAIMTGWDVLELNGVADYQGWGGLLLRRNESRQGELWKWATLRWSYGSCGGCDSYEDVPINQVIEQLGDLITVWESEEKARLTFKEGGW